MPRGRCLLSKRILDGMCSAEVVGAPTSALVGLRLIIIHQTATTRCDRRWQPHADQGSRQVHQISKVRLVYFRCTPEPESLDGFWVCHLQADRPIGLSDYPGLRHAGPFSSPRPKNRHPQSRSSSLGEPDLCLSNAEPFGHLGPRSDKSLANAALLTWPKNVGSRLCICGA